MRTKTIFNYVVAALFCCCVTGMFTSCKSQDDTGSSDNPSAVNKIKQGVWTEYDTALSASSEISGEQKTEDGLEYDVLSADIDDDLADIPTVGMKIEGSKAYFFTYSAEGADDLVEGKISYNKDAGTGVIAFPAIKDSPVSGQTVNFTMVSDELMQFEFTYEGKKATGSCVWLCDNLDNWGTGDESGWEELLPYYQAIAETAGPDGSIDWSGSATVTVEDVDDEGNPVEKEVTVTDLDKPLEWNDEVSSARASTRIAITSAISAGLDIFSSLFEPDPFEEINAKLDAVLGKLDNVLQNQQIMMAKLDEINGRLIEIAQRMEKTEIVNMFNNRNEKYYNKLKVQNTKYFNDAYNAYKANKNDPELANYAKAWVGKDEQYANLTWEYIEYLTTVEHTGFGKGMDRIYDGLVFNKYPWEHIGIGDRKSYRAYDLTMIAKCLFMISLYSTYGGLNNVEKKGLYNSYKAYKPQLKAFSEFKISDPDKFLVCQIPGAHFIMHKELQKYKFSGANNKAPHPDYCGGHDALYRPEWHEAGSVKVENPAELKSKLFSFDEIFAIQGYYKAAVYPNQNKISWKNMLVDGNKIAGGAVFAKQPTTANDFCLRLLLNSGTKYMGAHTLQNGSVLGIIPSAGDIWLRDLVIHGTLHMGTISGQYWSNYYSRLEYYAAIVEKRY